MTAYEAELARMERNSVKLEERIEKLERDHSIERQAHRIDALEARLESRSRELDRKIRQQTALDIEQEARDVEALVKAAADVHQFINGELLSQEMYGEHIREGMEAEDVDALETKLGWLNHCLKPFEAVKP